MRAVADTGPLVAAANVRDRAHRLAAALVTELGRELVVPLAVAVEVDQLLRARVGTHAAAAFLKALADGEHQVNFLTAGLLHRAVELDRGHASLGLGLADSAVMAVAERERLPVLTFDFEHFRRSRPDSGFWMLIVDEARYREAIER